MNQLLNPKKANKALFMNTFAFTICFSVWLINAVLVTFLVDNQVYNWTSIQVGWLIGIPVLTGALFRLPAGLLTDKFGGKPVFTILLLFCALPVYALSYADSFFEYALCSLGFGLSGTSFAVGIAYSSVWFPKEKQGTALGIFGAGNIGAAITTLVGPKLLYFLTDGKTNLEGWRTMPKIYAIALVVTAILFFLMTENKKAATAKKTLKGRLAPLKDTRVWRFGLYYFLVFGCFVAFAGWLVPYYTNVYRLDLITAGILVSCFSLPSALIRIAGGWISDLWGARKVMYWVLGSTVVISIMLVIPKMDIYADGKGVVNKKAGIVTEVTAEYVKVDDLKYPIAQKGISLANVENEFRIFPAKEVWQEAIVEVGAKVDKKELLIKGRTHIYFQANLWIFAILSVLMGCIWGIGMAAVYKHIPEYFPSEVGVVGGMVGVLGGLGGFICPILFGYLLRGTGLWSSSWLLMFFLGLVCFIWMHRVIQKMTKQETLESINILDQVNS